MTKADIARFDPNATLERWPDFPESEISSGTRASIGHRWIDDKAPGDQCRHLGGRGQSRPLDEMAGARIHDPPSRARLSWSRKIERR